MVNLQRACRAKIENAFVTCEAHYNVIIPRVPIKFSNHQKKTAGTAHYTKNMATGKLTVTEIRLSNTLLRLNVDDFIDRTPGHEAAHIVCVHLFNEGGHGRRWKEVMGVIGQVASRTHNMKLSTINQFRYVCTEGKEVFLSKVRHNKIQRNGVAYRMKNGGRLTKNGYQPAGRTVPSPQIRMATDKATTPKLTTSKAAIVREAIKTLKDAGATMQQVLNNTKVIQSIALESTLTASGVRSSIKYNWNK